MAMVRGDGALGLIHREVPNPAPPPPLVVPLSLLGPLAPVGLAPVALAGHKRLEAKTRRQASWPAA